MFGYNPYFGGMAITTDSAGVRHCWQGGNEVSCEEEDPYAGFVAPANTGGVTGGPKCAPGYYVDNSGNCVPQTPAPPVDVTCAPGYVRTAAGACIGLAPLPPAGQDYGACMAYVSKYRTVFGKDPTGIWCLNLAPCPQAGTRRADGTCPPIVVQPPAHPPEAPPPSTGPIHRWHYRRRPRPPVRQPYVEPPKPQEAELCPLRGYVSRPIPGVDEYQNVRCTPGQPVVLDPGLMAVVRQEALRRHGLAGLEGLDGFAVGNIEIPTWAIVAGAAVLALTVFRKGR